MIRSKRSLGLAAALVITTIYLPELAHAYVGPGAGFAFLGSGFVFILTILLGFATIAFWPLQWAWRLLRGKGIPKNARTRRVVIMGLDGLEPKLTERYMSEGAMPNLQRLAEQGTFSRLGTTLPALSPVAWSTFQTGVNPGAHNIFDFLTRDKRYCLPLLSSTEIDPPRTFGFGRWRIKLGGSRMRIMRKSKPFWHILGEHGIFSTVLRVPISFPAEPFDDMVDHGAADERLPDRCRRRPVWAILQQVVDRDGEVMVRIHQPGRGDDAVSVGVRVVPKGDLELAFESDETRHGKGAGTVHSDLAVMIQGHETELRVETRVHDGEVEIVDSLDGFPIAEGGAPEGVHADPDAGVANGTKAVSYTHLTLPTNREV